MSLFYSLILLILFNYVSGLSQLPLCQCECCPGDQCQSQLLIFSIDKCNDTTCSFEQCYKMYPNKCGLIPGITNTSCNGINEISSNSSNVPITFSSDATSFNVIPFMMMIILFDFLLIIY
jgi:hypothetical protein